jgi:hypothetical protein
MALTLAELLTAKTQTEIYSLLLGQLADEGFPVTAWQSGSVERTELMAFSSVLVDLVTNYLPTITGGGFLDYANTDWLRLLSSQQYENDYNQASFTIGTIHLAAASGSGPYAFNAGDLTITFGASGNRYICNESGTVPLSGSTDVSFTAENPGSSYADPSNSGDITLVTPLPGVTVTNPADDYSDVDHVGSGTGTLTLGGSPVGSHQVLINIDSTGASGVAGWSYQLDGAPFVSAGTVSSVTDLGGDGIDITLVNGGSGTSFVEGDTYLFSTPGSWITTQGGDDETNDALKTRDRNRWSSLSDIATEEYYELLARSTPSVGSQVTQVIVLPDADINNRLNITVAGPEGALPGGTVTAIQAYVSSRARITDNPVVQSPAGVDITLAATISVSFAQLSAAQDAAQTAMIDYVNSVGINGTIRISKIVELVMEITGIVDISGTTINAVAANFTLGSMSTFEVGELVLPLSFTWVTV